MSLVHNLEPNWSLDARQTHLRILATTDLHLNIMPYDYFTDRKIAHYGLARTASLIKSLRQIDALCMLFDNGDFLQGNPLSDWIAKDSDFAAGDLHPMIGAMNVLGYDGGTLGNHDFSYGLEFLQNTISGAKFPFVSANLTLSQGEEPRDDITVQRPWQILPRTIVTADGQSHSIQVGIIGFAPPQTPMWEQFSIGDQVRSRDIVSAAKDYVPQMRAAGADIVIALSHSGIDYTPPSAWQENASLSLAAVPGIDAIIAGHTHGVFPGPGRDVSPSVDRVVGTLHGIPSVMAGCYGSHVGVIDLKLEHTGSGWRVADFRSVAAALRDVQGDSEEMDADVVTSVQGAHDKVVAQLQQQIGSTVSGLHSYLTFVGHAPASQVLADAMHNKAVQLLSDTQWASLPITVAVAPSRSGGQIGSDNFVDIPAGPLLLRHAAELYHFPNTMCIMALTGADVRDWLEWSARLFLPIEPGVQEQELIDAAMPGYNFDTLFGLTYEIDPSKPAAERAQNGEGKRISHVRLPDGRAVEPDQDILLVTNNYRASGGGGYAMAQPEKIVLNSDDSLRDVALEHIQNGQINATADPVWRFSTLPATSALFDSGDSALAHLCEAQSTSLEDAGAGPGGFHRFRLRF